MPQSVGIGTSGYHDSDLFVPGTTVRAGVTVFLYGAVGTYKTTWAGLWPKPIFLSIGPEGGDDSLAMLKDIYGVQPPPCYRITSASMMKQKVEKIVRDYQIADYNTVVVDSITYYQDLWIAEIMGVKYSDPAMRKKIAAAGGEAGFMDYRDWGKLSMHFRDLATMLHRTPLNVIWIALEKEQFESTGDMQRTKVGVKPHLSGQYTELLPGMCKMIIHATKQLRADPNVPGRMLAHPIFYTSPNMMAQNVRHKYGTAFPEGRLIDPWHAQEPNKYPDIPTFTAIESRIGKFIYRTGEPAAAVAAV